MSRVIEAVLPARMGTSFRWLVGSSWTGNLGDGIGLAAEPLLVVSQTSDPFLAVLTGCSSACPGCYLLGTAEVSSTPPAPPCCRWWSPGRTSGSATPGSWPAC